MNIMKKPLSLAILASCFVITGASAETALVSEVKTPEQTLKVINERMLKVSPGLGANSAQLDFTLKGFQAEFGGNYLPITLSGQRYLTDTEGSIIMEPSKAFMFNGKNELSNVNDTFIKLELMSEENKDRVISHSLPDGVDKKGDLFVLTDPTCGYCHKVEEEVENYLNSGIVVHYIPYPRAGIVDVTNAGYALWAKAACAENPAKAYHDVSLRIGDYKSPDDMNDACTDIIKDGYAFGRKISITGTPYMFAVGSDGDSFSSAGYLPYESIAERLGVQTVNLSK